MLPNKKKNESVPMNKPREEIKSVVEDAIDEAFKNIQMELKKGNLIKSSWKKFAPQHRTPLEFNKLLYMSGVDFDNRYMVISSIFGSEAVKRIFQSENEDTDTDNTTKNKTGVFDELDEEIRKIGLIRSYKTKLNEMEGMRAGGNDKKSPTYVETPIRDKDGNITGYTTQPVMEPGTALTLALMNMVTSMVGNQNKNKDQLGIKDIIEIIQILDKNKGNGNDPIQLKLLDKLDNTRQDFTNFQLQQIKESQAVKNDLLQKEYDRLQSRANMTPTDYLKDLKESVALANDLGLGGGKSSEDRDREERRNLINQGLELIGKSIENVGTPLANAVGMGLKEGIANKMKAEALSKMTPQKIKELQEVAKKNQQKQQTPQQPEQKPFWEKSPNYKKAHQNNVPEPEKDNFEEMGGF